MKRRRGTPTLAAGLLALALGGCGEATSLVVESAPTTYDGPVERPTKVPPADGRVTTTNTALVTDDGTGPWMCWSPNVEFGGRNPHVCADARVTGWDWEAVGEFRTEAGVRWGWFDATGTFDGSTFAVEDAGQPDPPPYDFDLEIPCPTPASGWRVLDPALTTDVARSNLTTTAEALPGFALIAVSTTQGEPGPRNAEETMVTVHTAGDVAATETALREVWGGMLCVTRVEHSYRELERIQHQLLDMPGMTEVGSGNPDNQVELMVFNDDGTLQRWVDQEYGAGVVVVESNLQPAG